MARVLGRSRGSIVALTFTTLRPAADHLRDGDVLLSKSTSGLAEGRIGEPPLTIFFALISLPYNALLASLSASIDAPVRDTPANNPLEREYVRTSAFIVSAL